MKNRDVHVVITVDDGPFQEAVSWTLQDIYRRRVLDRYARLLRAAMDRGELSPAEALSRLRRAEKRID